MAQAAIIFGHTADAEIDGVNAKVNATANILQIGQVSASGANQQRRNAIFVFDLAGVGTIVSATLDLFLVSIDGSPAFNGDLWGVGYSDVASSFPSTATFNVSEADAANTLIQDNFVVPTSTTGQYLGTSSGALVDYLNTRTDDFVYFRLSQDAAAGANNFYTFTSADGTSNQLPSLIFSENGDPPSVAIPEPASMALWGLLSLMGICFWRRQAIGLSLGRTSPT